MNKGLLRSLIEIQRKMNSEHRAVNLEGSTGSSRRRKRSSSGSFDSEGSIRGSCSSSHRNKGKRCYQNDSCDEFKKARPPIFNGEVKIGQEAEAWLLEMKKYFQVQDYSGKMKERVSIFNLNGRESIWWENLRQVKNINDRNIVWKKFKKYFKLKYVYNR